MGMVVAAPKPRITRWYVESDGKRVGPFTLGQLQTEFRAGRVRSENLAIPVNETGAPEGQTRSVKQLLDQFLDPAVSLFDTLRAAKEKRTPQKKHWSIPDSMNEPPRTVFKMIPDQAWLFGGLILVFGLLVMISVTFIRESGRMLTPRTEEQPRPVATTQAPAPAVTAPVRTKAVSKPLLTPVLPAPAPIVRRPIIRPAPAPVPIRRDDARDDRRDDRDRRDDQPLDRDITPPKGDENMRNPDNPQGTDPRDARDRDPAAAPIDPNTLRDNAPNQ
jgi:hypothetical protein